MKKIGKPKQPRRMPRVRKPKTFKPGTVVIWDYHNFNKEFWGDLSEKKRNEYYGVLGYGAEKPKLFVYMGEILDADGNSSGHCVLIDMDDQHVETMRHTCEFRAATDEEF